MDKLLEGSKKMIFRGTAGRKMPYGKVNSGDNLYFINNNVEWIVKASGIDESVYNSEKMSRAESTSLVEENKDILQLTDDQYKRWAGKRYLVLIMLKDIESIDPFEIDRNELGIWMTGYLLRI